MAAILIIIGGMIGFVAALAALLLFDATLLNALAIWSETGILVLVLGLCASAASSRLGDGTPQTAI